MHSNEIARVSSSTQFTRRHLLGAIGLGATVYLLSGCAGAATPSAPGAAVAPAPTGVPASGAVSTAVPATGQPNTGGTLRAISLTDLIPIDGHYHHPGNGLSSW